MTPLPEPVTDVWASWRGERELLSAWGDYFTAEQMREYGAAEYRRGIVSALAVLASRGFMNSSLYLQVKQLLEAK